MVEKPNIIPSGGGLITTVSDTEGLSKLTKTLTPREKDVLGLLGKGRHNDEIAGELDIKPKTVEHHVSNLMNKFNVRGRLGVVVRALETGYLYLQPPESQAGENSAGDITEQ